MDTLTKSDRAALVAMIDERDRRLRQNEIDKSYQAGLDKGKDTSRGLESGVAFLICFLMFILCGVVIGFLIGKAGVI